MGILAYLAPEASGAELYVSTERQFPMAISWSLHETTVGRIIKKVEDVLVKCGKFRRTCQRAVYQSGWEGKVCVVDVSEMEIERQKKNSGTITSATRSNHNY